ncbi:hypothetical protein IMSAGC011_01477 [Lachnospiraceae bacterium]|nr:hypothetical protein IMSAGC011_01477 [Lachnospiraceae bacterium]
MLYEKYHLFNDGLEIMIPSDIKRSEAFLPFQNNWISKDKRTVINIARGGEDLTNDNLDDRLNEYYRRFCKEINQFVCKRIGKRTINRKIFGELQYLSHMTGYCFYNIFLLGSYKSQELIVTIQCMENRRKEYLYIFEHIIDSIRILRKQEDMI